MTVKLTFCEERQEVSRTKRMMASKSESKEKKTTEMMRRDMKSRSWDNSEKTTGQEWSTEVAF